jgi:DNA-binding NarL/FixJ family response regulator
MLVFLQSHFKVKYNVYYAFNGEEALRKIKWIPLPDLIISDIMMDEMDGNEFYEELKKDNTLNNIPFIFLTAKSTSDDKIKGLLKGAVDYIYKPFLIDELAAKVDSITKNRENQRKINIDEFEKKLHDLLNKKNRINYEHLFKKYKINPKEKIVIMLLKDGLEYKEIGVELNLSLSGVKKRIYNIYKKCGVQNKLELFNLFYDY